MKTRWLAFVSMIIILLVAVPAMARKWTSSDGRFSIEATLLDHNEQFVKLKKSDGTEIKVPLARLSVADRKHIASLSKPATTDSRPSAGGNAGKTASDVLKSKGIRAVSAGLMLVQETQLSKGLGGVFKFRKTLIDANKELATLQKRQEANKQQITLLTQQNVQLNAQLVNATDVSTNNKLVGLINANNGQMQLLRQGSEQIEELVRAARKTANEARESYVQHILDLRKLCDSIGSQYTELAADATVKTAIAQLNQDTGKAYQLVESRGYQSSVAKLKSLEDTVLSESIKLRRDSGGTLNVSVVIDGKHTQEMVLDSGASLISLPQAVAAKCGIEVKSTDPEIILELADGRQIQGRLVKIDSVRVGKFIVKDVECAVLGREAISAPPLLGMSFLGNFKFEINAQEEKLTMVKVETPESGRPTRRSQTRK